jgi:hypothetical protein
VSSERKSREPNGIDRVPSKAKIREQALTPVEIMILLFLAEPQPQRFSQPKMGRH